MTQAEILMTGSLRQTGTTAPIGREVRRPTYNLNLLVVFAAVFETRSTTGAAERLRLSQPAISHALARLRHDMDDPLFLRRGRAFVPTPRAVELSALVHRLLDDARRIFQGSTFDPVTTNRTFRVALGEDANLALVRALGRRLREQAPGAGLAIDPLSDQAVSRVTTCRLARRSGRSRCGRTPSWLPSIGITHCYPGGPGTARSHLMTTRAANTSGWERPNRVALRLMKRWDAAGCNATSPSRRQTMRLPSTC